jgi:adenylate cyclase
MAQEIERKFLVVGPGWRRHATGQLYRQGYLARTGASTVRVRTCGDRAWLTIKGATTGMSRLELEYPIPVDDAAEMLSTLCSHTPIEKHRYRIEHAGLTWEVDEFHGANEGLILAEVELEREDQEVDLPDWIGEEVTSDPRYYNANLVDHPFSEW